MYTCTYIYIYTFMCVYICMKICVYERTRIYITQMRAEEGLKYLKQPSDTIKIYSHIWEYFYLHVCLYIHICIRIDMLIGGGVEDLHLCVYICMHVHGYVYMYNYAYIYAYSLNTKMYLCPEIC